MLSTCNLSMYRESVTRQTSSHGGELTLASVLDQVCRWRPVNKSWHPSSANATYELKFPRLPPGILKGYNICSADIISLQDARRQPRKFQLIRRIRTRWMPRFIYRSPT